MARLASDFKFEGTLGDFSAYRMQGVDKIIVRRKGGPKKAKILKDPKFVNVRRNISEFSARGRATHYLNKAIWLTRTVADWNFTGTLNALLRPIQDLDDSAWGKRNVLLSKNPRILEGFSLNKLTPFDTIIRNPLTYTLSKETLTATVSFPELMPGITFYPQQRYPMFRLYVQLGIMPDMLIDGDRCYPAVKDDSKFSESRWIPVKKGSEAMTLTVQLPTRPENDNFSLILSVAVAYGSIMDDDKIRQAKPGGGGKILATI